MPPRDAGSAKGKAKSNASNRKAPTPQVRDTGEFIARLGPILEPYGWSEGDIDKLVLRCNFDEAAIQEAVGHVLDEREGHEQGQWASIATVSEKKESISAAKERKAKKEKERAEEEERKKQERQKILEEEKKRHLEQEARKEAALLQKKQPGGSLVRRAAATEARPNAWKQNKEDDEPSPAENQGARTESKAEKVQQEESWGYDDNQWYEEQESGAKYEPQEEKSTAEITTETEPASQAIAEVSHPTEETSGWGSQTWEAPESNVAPSSTQTKPWTSHWASEESTSWNANDTSTSKTETKASVEPVVNGKSHWSSDAVVMPPSFWALMGDRLVPAVTFGTYHA